MLSLLIWSVLATPATPAAPATPCHAPHIQAHLDTVLAELEAADPDHLTAAQRERRAHHLAVLAEYRDACEFPTQDFAPDRLVTVFVDDHDVHCAVGYLMMRDGRADLVTRIRQTRNTATIQELSDDPEVLAWLASAGLSPHDAARIQPSYCMMYFGGSCLCADKGHMGPIAGVAEATITAIDPEQNAVTATLNRVHGTGREPGDSLTVVWVEGDTVGREVLVVLRTEHLGTELEAARGKDPVDDHVSCTSQGMMTGEGSYCAYVPTSVYIDALRSEDCMGTLAAHDPRLAESVCDLDGAACTSSGLPANARDTGCGAGHAPLSTLLALAALLRLTTRSRAPLSRRRRPR